MAKWLPDPIYGTLSPASLLATVLFGEIRGHPLREIAAVASVVRNRVEKTAQTRQIDYPWPPALWRSILLKPWAFSCLVIQGGPLNAAATAAFAHQVATGTKLQDANERLCWLAQLTMDGLLLDQTHGATHYIVRTMPGKPSWAQADQWLVASIGPHDFFRLPDQTYD